MNNENIKIAKVCGLCAGCTNAISVTEKLLQSKKSVTLFKYLVHNKNVNNRLMSLGATICESKDEILNWKNSANQDAVVIVRAHGEPPETFEWFKQNSISFEDCTCINVKRIHECVQKFSNDGYQIILIGKYGKFSGEIHPEVFGTLGWCNGDAILVEDKEDLIKIENSKNQKFYLVCQTTFNTQKANELIEEIKNICENSGKEIIINKSICLSQKIINQSSADLANQSDLMIVVGGKNSSNTRELANALSNICKCVFLEDINLWKQELENEKITLSPEIKIGITAGASTMREELNELKSMIKNAIDKIN